MKHNAKSLLGFAMGATDGEIGKVKEFYFDDKTWTVRYLIVETGGWLSGRRVLIAPQAITVPNWEEKIFPINLTKEQVKTSPEIDTNIPVSRQQELALYRHYPWGTYWGAGLWAGGMGTTGMLMPIHSAVEDAIERQKADDDNRKDDDPHLRSTDTVTGYAIKATDGDIGDVEDFIINDSNWKIDFIEVDTGNWFPGKKVVLPPSLIQTIKWETSEVVVNASVDQVKNSPEYERDKAMDDAYASLVESYYSSHFHRDQSSKR